MKKIHRQKWVGLTLAAATAITLGACKKAPSTSEGGTDGEKPAAKEPAKKTLAEQVIGKWGVDKAATIKALEGATDLDPAMAAMAKPMIEKVAGMIALEVTKDSSSFHGPGEVKNGPYTMSDVDEAAGTFTLAFDNEEKKVSLDGDTMTALGEGEPPMVLTRIDDADFKARTEAAAAFNPASLFEGVGGGIEELGAELENAIKGAVEGALEDAGGGTE